MGSNLFQRSLFSTSKYIELLDKMLTVFFFFAAIIICQRRLKRGVYVRSDWEPYNPHCGTFLCNIATFYIKDSNECFCVLFVFTS